MKTLQKFIFLGAFFMPGLIPYSSHSQGAVKIEPGSHLISEPGSFWVVKNGSVTLTSQDADNPATMANLKIVTGASLIIEPSSYLTVTGTLSNTAGNGGLVVRSGASLIESTASVPGTVQRSVSPGQWHLISSPVSNAVSGMFTGYYLQQFSEPANSYSDIIQTDVLLSPVQGYALFGDAGMPTATYTGSLNTGYRSIGTTCSGAGKGWNLVGNPYCSSIDWNAPGWTKTNINGSIYFHVNSATWATWNGYTGTNGGTQYIATGQGFFVEATAAGLLGMNNDVRVHNATTFFKDSPKKINNMIRLEVTGNGFSDEAVVWFLPEATAGFDGEFDAHKLFGDVPGAAQIYTLGNTPLAINVLPEVLAVPLGIHAGAGGTYTIAATEINDFTEVFLEDTRKSVFTDMLKDSYSFTFTPGDVETRFVLHFGPLPVKEKENPGAAIYSCRQTVYIDLEQHAAGEVFIYSLSGQLVISAKVTSGINRISLAGTGIYIVRLMTDATTMVRKVWIE